MLATVQRYNVAFVIYLVVILLLHGGMLGSKQQSRQPYIRQRNKVVLLIPEQHVILPPHSVFHDMNM